MKDAVTTQPGYFREEDCRIEDFRAAVERRTVPSDIPFARGTEHEIPIYDAVALGTALEGAERRALMAEWAGVLRHGAGVIVLKRAYDDTTPIDAATAIYTQIIADEASAGGGADHFAKAGSNARIWNSLQKLCLADPATFARYFGNASIAAACEAWLGPNYQMTAQVNLVRPGGAAQEAHRDYHLGFQTADASAQYPAHVHDLSPVMTLQGAVAHCDMPVESGPTKLLPFSQAYRPGYAAWRRPEFRAYFEEHCVQLPLEKGDALFFNPALFHAAGANRSTDIQRMGNLLQVSSAFGRAMESIDRGAMCRALFPVLSNPQVSGAMGPAATSAAIAAAAEGYSFPTNLDRDPPKGGLAPETQAALFHRALGARWTANEFDAALAEMAERQRP